MRLRTITSNLLKIVTLAFSLLEFEAYATYVNCSVLNLDPIVPKGNRFFHSVTGEHFPIKGIAYHPRPNDGPLSIPNSVDFYTDDYRFLWEQDIANFRRLGVNTIRLYSVDPSVNHDSFMCALQEAGIYVILDLLADCEDCGIGPNEAPSCYPNSLKRRGQFIINEFSKYSNLLLFSAGNEVTLYARDRQYWINAACQKKFIRDMRWYVDTCSANPLSSLPRKVPIGMANWDNNRTTQARYFTCRTDPEDQLENAEWYGLNTYQHCDPNATSVDQLLGWQNVRGDFALLNLSVPVVITEYGCRERFPTIGDFEAQRNWLQVDALYSPLYAATFAGAVVFEYSAEKRIVDTSPQGHPWPYYGFMKLNYGVGYYSPVDCDHITIPCEYNEYPEFELLAAKLAQVVGSRAFNINTFAPRGEIPECPDGLPPLSNFTWPADSEPDMPCALVPTSQPTLQPSSVPTMFPSVSPSTSPSHAPSTTPPTVSPSQKASARPSTMPPAVPPTRQVETIADNYPPSFFSTNDESQSPTASPTIAVRGVVSSIQSSGGMPHHLWIGLSLIFANFLYVVDM